GWPAGMEVLSRRPLVLLDCAHSLASARAVVETLGSFPRHPRRLLVFAGSGDKDLAGILGVLAPHFAYAYLTRYSQGTRSVPPERLAELLPPGAVPFSLHPTAAEAWRAAPAGAGPDDPVRLPRAVVLARALRPPPGTE